MDLLKTLLIYMAMVFAGSVQSAPEAMDILTATPEPTVYVAPATPTPAPTPVPTPVPTIDITPNPAYKTLQVGDRGDLVRAMQEKLIEYGYLSGEADGAYGNQTRMAVEAFQYQHGLSADGIAGRRTLTVLYESSEIRLSPEMTATPEPTFTAQLMVAITPSPTVTPAFVPVVTAAVQTPVPAESTAAPEPTAEPEASPEPTPVPTAEPTPVPTLTAAPTAVPTPTPMPELEPMTDYAIRIAEGAGLKAHPCRGGEKLYLPLLEIMEAAEVMVITSDSEGKYELAFARGEELVHVAYERDKNGEPVNLEFFINTVPQLLPSRDARSADGSLYLPIDSFETISGFDVMIDQSVPEVVVSCTAKEKE